MTERVRVDGGLGVAIMGRPVTAMGGPLVRQIKFPTLGDIKGNGGNIFGDVRIVAVGHAGKRYRQIRA